MTPLGRAARALIVAGAAALAAVPSQAQCEVQKLVAGDAAAGDWFGTAVALDDDWALVGAWNAAGPGVGPGVGAAYFLERAPSGWLEHQKVAPSDSAPFQRFGGALAIQADRALVCAAGDAQAGAGAGAVYAFALGGGGWSEVQKIVAGDAAVEDFFGYSVALDADLALVGAYRDDDAAPDAGSAYVLEHGPAGWVEAGELHASDAAPGDWFGHSVQVLADAGGGLPLALVGAHHDADAGPKTGAAYVFERRPNGWLETAKLTASDGAEGDRFGHAVALAVGADGVPRALIGARFQGPFGAAYVFERRATGWVELAKLVPSEGVAAAQFAFAVDLQGDLALCGAYRDDPAGPRSGSVTLFERVGAGWPEKARFVAPDAAPGAELGSSVALRRSTGSGAPASALIGAWRDSGAGFEAGAAYAWPLEVGGRYCVALPSSAGAPARIAAVGPASVSANALVLWAAPVPDQPGLFFYGPNRVQLPFGDGFRCVGGGVFRLPPGAGHWGALRHALDLASPPVPGGAIQPGSTWSFQAWYRDPAAGGSGFNLSDGLTIDFCP